MRVKIGNKIYNSSEQPIMIIFEGDEKELITDTDPEEMRFCSCPVFSAISEIEEFMEINEQDKDQISMVIENDTIFVPMGE